MPTAVELHEIAGTPERQVSLRELETKLDSYIRDVESGATVVNRDARQVARIIPGTDSAEQERTVLKPAGRPPPFAARWPRWARNAPASHRPSTRSDRIRLFGTSPACRATLVTM